MKRSRLLIWSVAVLLPVLILSLAMVAGAEAEITPGTSVETNATGIGLDAAPLTATGCLPTYNVTGPGQNIYDTGGDMHWAGVIYAQIPPGSATRTPTYCTDLISPIGAGDCFQTDGPTACPITWLLNNGYGPSSSISDAESAARQAAVWYYSDGIVVRSTDPVYARTQQIIAAVPSPCSMPASAPILALDPASDVNYIPGGETHAMTVTVTQDGNPLSGQVVSLSRTGSGTLSASSVTTNASGQATFTITSSSTGSATIQATLSYVLPAGTRFTKLDGADDQQVLVLGTPQTGTIVATASKTWVSGTVIVGHKFHDMNTNGVQDSGEESLQGWTLRLYKASGSNWNYVATGSTNSSGNYTFSGISAGTYRMQETLQSGWYNTTPNPSAQVTVAEGQQATINFGNVALAVIKAWKFWDYDGDGVRDAGEPVLNGWTMNISPAINGIGSGVTSAGSVSFIDLPPGTYTLWETQQTGWTATTTASRSVTVGENDFAEEWFGNWKGMDLGDLPDSYGTTLASNGPRHSIGALYLGSLIDAEANGQPSTDAGGDDMATSGDEDGTDDSLLRDWRVGTGAGCLPITVAGGNGFLTAWIDWGHDGTFAEAGDKIIDNVAVVAGSQTVCFDVPQSFVAGGVIYARLRLFAESTPGAAPTGFAINGEIEDYRWDAQPLAVQLQSFTAASRSGGMALSWDTVSEVDTLGFRVYRSLSATGPWEQVGPALIPSAAPGSGDGNSYVWTDASAVGGTTYFYELVEVTTDGSTSLLATLQTTFEPKRSVSFWLPLF